MYKCLSLNGLEAILEDETVIRKKGSVANLLLIWSQVFVYYWENWSFDMELSTQ